MLHQVIEKLMLDYDLLKQQIKKKDNEYQQLEQAMQKGENAIRMHIKVQQCQQQYQLQQQMKLHSNYIQDQLDSQIKQDESLQQYKDKVEENEGLNAQIKLLQEEIRRLVQINLKLVKTSLEFKSSIQSTKKIKLDQEQEKRVNGSSITKIVPGINLGFLDHFGSLPSSLIQTIREDSKVSLECDSNKRDPKNRSKISVTTRQMSNVSKNISMRNLHDFKSLYQGPMQNCLKLPFKANETRSNNHSQDYAQSLSKLFSINKVIMRKDSESAKKPTNKQIQFSQVYLLDSKR